MKENIQKCLNLLVLQRLPYTAAGTLQKLYVQLGSTEKIIDAPHEKLSKIIHTQALMVFEEFRKKGLKSVAGQQAQKDYEQILKRKTKILSIEDEEYPEQLKEIYSAPPILLVEGDIGVLSKNQIAIIGSRKASPTGLENAQQFANELASVGIVVTSGLALGIDTAAHRGALQVDNELNSKPTVAVIASGIDICYPSRNNKLMEEIIERGAIVTEFPLSASPRRENFPRRNRIISGLAKGVLIVEAELKSGSLITARYALEQNREVFAIPGSIKNPASRGCHQLIREGAKLVECVDDVLSELDHPFGQIRMQWGEKREKVQHKKIINQVEKEVMECLDENPVTIDQIMRRAGLTAEAAASALVSLEIAGWVEMQDGKYRNSNSGR